MQNKTRKRLISVLLSFVMLLGIIPLTAFASTNEGGNTSSETLTICGTKAWNDNDDAAKKRPDSLTVTLYKDMGTAQEKEYSSVATSNSEWRFQFDVPISDLNQSSTYTVVEESVDGYVEDIEKHLNPTINFSNPSIEGAWERHNPNNNLIIPTYTAGEAIVAANLTGKYGNKMVVWSEKELDSDAQEIIKSSINDNVNGINAKSWEFIYGKNESYSVDKTVLLSVTDGTVTFSDPSVWNHVIYGKYVPGRWTATEAAITNNISNSEPTTPDNFDVTVPVKKTVALGGNKAPGSTDFTFELTPRDKDYPALTIAENTLTVTGAGEATGKIKLSGTFPKEYSGISYTLTEKNDGKDNWTYDEASYIVIINQKEVADADGGATGKYTYEVVLQKEEKGMNPVDVEIAEFTNTYTKNSSGGSIDPTPEPEPSEPTEPTNPSKPDKDDDDDDPVTPARPSEPSKPSSPDRPVDNVPQTDDSSNMGLWSVLAAISLLGMAALAFGKKRFARRSR